MQFEVLAAAIKEYYPNPDLEQVKKAYDFAERAHSGQVRVSGEPYFNHIVETALLVAKLKLDLPSIEAALLHDTMEDCHVTYEDIKQNFGQEVSDIVEGVTKLTRTEFASKEEKQAENFRKMLLAMAKDIRVILVKLCDRLHNMQTLGFHNEAKQRQIAQETFDIYAPLAARLGIYWLKSELEDLCLMYLRPEMYNLIRNSYNETNREREKFIAETTKLISETLESAGVSASVYGRAKHFCSIWKKMEDQNLTFGEIHDLLGFRVVVPTLRACYESLGVIHSTWKPVPNRFKDYIAVPKPNMYQSLHTTVIGPDGNRIEIQIRTPDMHRVAEEGIAAHWKYKEGKLATNTDFDLQWVKELVDSQQYLKNPDEFIQSIKGDLFPEEVFVFTPKGDLIRLPYKSTPLDFAYAIHTDVGNRTTGARCNGIIVPLEHRLENGDTVEIITSKNQVPGKNWLKMVHTSKAKQRIRAFLKVEEHAQSFAIGYEILSKDLRKVKLSIKQLEKDGKMLEVAKYMGLRNEQDLYAEIGYGKISSTKVLSRVLPADANVEEKLNQKDSPLQRIFQRAAKISRQKVGVKVTGFDDILIRFARCCEPLPGDRIVGFITRGRGVTVHLANCSQVLKGDPLRKVDVLWDSEMKNPRRIWITVHSQDQPGLLANVSQAIASQGANIASAQCKTSSVGKAVNQFELVVSDSKQMGLITRAIEMVPGVIKVERLKHV